MSKSRTRQVPLSAVDYAASVTEITRPAGMLKIGDGFGIHLNVKPMPFHLLMMQSFFGWTWVEDHVDLTERQTS